MSVAIIQKPDNSSYSSMVKDFIFSATTTFLFELIYLDQAILTETYTPNADGKVFVRALGDVCRDYLAGDVLFSGGEQLHISGVFSVKVDGIQVHSFTALRCDAYLNNYCTVKKMGGETRLTYTSSPEFLTTFIDKTIKCSKLRLFPDETIQPVETKDFFVANFKMHTLNVSNAQIRSKYTSWDTDIIGYRISSENFWVDYLIDDHEYLQLDHFLYKNSFGVNETISVVSEVKRKLSVTGEMALVHSTKKKYNIRRNDSFEVNVGVLRTADEYIRLRDMFTAEEIFLYVNYEWLPIVITDIKDENPELLANVGPISFTYEFSNYKHNLRL